MLPSVWLPWDNFLGQTLNISPMTMNSNVEYATAIDTRFCSHNLTLYFSQLLNLDDFIEQHVYVLIYFLDFLNIRFESQSAKNTGRFRLFTRRLPVN